VKYTHLISMIIIAFSVFFGVCFGESINEYPGWDTIEQKSMEILPEVARAVIDAVINQAKQPDYSSIHVTNYLEIAKKGESLYAAAIYDKPSSSDCEIRKQYLVWLTKTLKNKYRFRKLWEHHLMDGLYLSASLESVNLLRGEKFPCLFVVSAGGANTQ
jgi:hypothetical protein